MPPTLLDLPPGVEPLPRGVDLPYSDGVPLESLWHRAVADLLLVSLHWHWHGKTDFFAGANQFIYFDPAQAKNNNFRGPDFYVVKDVSHEPIRRSWVVWEEGGRVPNVVVEFVSESTAETDRVDKKRVYLEQLDVQEYYCYAPEGYVLEGWRKGVGKRKPVALKVKNGRLWSEELQLWLGSWEGEYLGYRDTWLRFFTEAGELVPTPGEAEAQRADNAEAQRIAEAQRANAAEAQRVAETQRAEAEALRAAAETQRANAAEAELAKLRAELERLRNSPNAR